ncbi:Hypothetical protein NTJ_02036 [Nesidiocoris tenuis]|uniref:Uncharacterized protein n=1 Tax=Nesidiocoris tenuis TaxID=355587 RepID=A0ABN7AA83_9HEMI|nr:Hypothetical protein NTJ_02036 [Nesidiocoris tenuis]
MRSRNSKSHSPHPNLFTIDDRTSQLSTSEAKCPLSRQDEALANRRDKSCFSRLFAVHAKYYKRGQGSRGRVEEGGSSRRLRHVGRLTFSIRILIKTHEPNANIVHSPAPADSIKR